MPVEPQPPAGRSDASGGMAHFDLVIFDCDGVLVDSEVLSACCLAEHLTAAGMPIDAGGVHVRYLGRRFDAVLDDLAVALGGAPPADFAATVQRDLLRRFTTELRPMPGASAILRRMPVRYCLASSSERARIAHSLGVTGLDRYFSDAARFDAAMVEAGKPAPDLFRLAARRMGAQPDRTLVIEDSVSGVAAGKAAGMTVWGFIGGSHAGPGAAEALRRAGADRIVADMETLGGSGHP